MRKIIITTVAALAVLTGCGSSGTVKPAVNNADPAACRAAMDTSTTTFYQWTTDPTTRPAACKGIEGDAFNKLAGEWLVDVQKRLMSPSPTATSANTVDVAACRAAMKPGYKAGWSDGRHFPPAAYEPVCAGVDRTTLQRLADEIIAEAMNA